MEVGYDVINNVNLLHARNMLLAAQNGTPTETSNMCTTPIAPRYRYNYMEYSNHVDTTPTTSRYPPPPIQQQQLQYHNSHQQQLQQHELAARWMTTTREDMGTLVNYSGTEVESQGVEGKICVVCGDKASGVHYKVMTCEGCKGFWRRTIQRGCALTYRCKSGTNQCAVNLKARSRCQRCRYTACVNAGMMADLVMSEKERLSRSRLVDQNREKRRGATAQEELTVEDIKVFTTVHIMYTKFLSNTQDLDACTLYSRCVQFSDSLRAELMKLASSDQDVNENMYNPNSVYETVFYLFLTYSLEPGSFTAVPSLAKLATYIHTQEVSRFSQEYLEVALAILVMRPQLTWPRDHSSIARNAWQLVSAAVKRRFSASAELKLVYMTLFKCVHSAAFVANSINISQILEFL